MLAMKMFVWDTETTGIDCQVDRLVEIAAMELDMYGLPLMDENYEFRCLFETYVDPQRDIPPEAKCVHHITEKMVAGAPVEVDAVGNMISALDIGIGDLFVAHNARFDRGFLKRIAPAIDKSLQHVCTMKCAQVIWPDAPGYSNQFLRYWLGLEPRLPKGLMPHRAAYDIAVTATIFVEERKHKSIDEMLEISNKPVLLKRMPMGKHKGCAFDQVPLSYLRWILDQPDGAMGEDLVYTAKYWYSKTRSFR